jgi:hypothetical protein
MAQPKTNGTYLAPADDLPAFAAPDLAEPEYAELSGVLADSGRAPKLLTKADQLLESLRSRIANIEKAVAEGAARISDESRIYELRNTGRSDVEIDSRIRKNVNDSVAAAAKARIADFRRDLENSSESDRAEVLRQLASLDKLTTALLPLYESPMVVLSRAGIGSQERQHYQSQVASSGPVELTALARLAIAKKDRILGAAVASRLGELRKEQRPFSAAELADTLVGSEQKTVHAALSSIRHRFQEALNANREFRKGASLPLSKIHDGLARRAEQ